jgi:hypothetical protein
MAGRGNRNKYGATTTVCGRGHKHASKREASRCGELHMLFHAGAIDGLVIEPTYELKCGDRPIYMSNGHRARYRPDFSYIEHGNVVVEDVKGIVVRDFPLRAALFRACYPDIELRVVK